MKDTLCSLQETKGQMKSNEIGVVPEDPIHPWDVLKRQQKINEDIIKFMKHQLCGI